MHIVFNFVHSYKATSDFLCEKLGKNCHLLFNKVWYVPHALCSKFLAICKRKSDLLATCCVCVGARAPIDISLVQTKYVEVTFI
jgi:hypothetical protein